MGSLGYEDVVVRGKLNVPERNMNFVTVFGPEGITAIFIAAHHTYLFWVTRPMTLNASSLEVRNMIFL